MATFEYTLNSEYAQVKRICTSIQKDCKKCRIKEDKCYAIEVALLEALNNVVKHAYKGVPGNPIRVMLEVSQEKIEIKIFDEGSGEPRKKAETLSFDPVDIINLPEGGMGLFIIEKLMDQTEFKVENKKNVFSMIKYIN